MGFGHKVYASKVVVGAWGVSLKVAEMGRGEEELLQ
jgi:hypothetical protein